MTTFSTQAVIKHYRNIECSIKCAKFELIERFVYLSLRYAFTIFAGVFTPINCFLVLFCKILLVKLNYLQNTDTCLVIN